MLSLPTHASLAAFILLTGCSGPAQTIRIDGSLGVMPLIEAVVRDYRARNRDASVVIGTGLSSSARIQALAEGRIDIATASHGVDTADIRRRGMELHEVARTAVVFGVNPTTSVSNLTPQQVCDIYAGKVGNWRQVGGADLVMRVGMRPLTEVDAEAAVAGIGCLRGITFGPDVQWILRPDDMAAAIATTPGAIGVTSLTVTEQSGGRIRPLALDGVDPTAEHVERGSYPMSRRAILITRGNPGREVKRLLAFIASDDGARVLRANGAVPLN